MLMLATAGQWLIGSKAGRILLLCAAALTALWIYGAHERGVGAERQRAQTQRNDAAAVERADDAENAVRRDPDDVSRSLSNGTF